MSSLYPQNLMAYLAILAIFIRLMAFFIFVPAFSHSAIPPMVKTIFALSLSLAFYPMVRGYLPTMSNQFEGIILLALRESAIGSLMGFAAYLTFEAINLSGQFVGYQMGFGTAGMMDPQNHANVSILVAFQGWIVMMVFFFTDMHHQLVETFLLSFQITQKLTGDSLVGPALLKQIVMLTSQLFILAIQMAAPFTFLVLACNIGIGVLARLLPQMNIILFSFPITILLGFLALYFLVPDLMDYFELRLADMSMHIVDVLRVI